MPEVLAAKRCLSLARKEFPGSTVSIADAVKKCFTEWQREAIKPAGLDAAKIEKLEPNRAQ